MIIITRLLVVSIFSFELHEEELCDWKKEGGRDGVGRRVGGLGIHSLLSPSRSLST